MTHLLRSNKLFLTTLYAKPILHLSPTIAKRFYSTQKLYPSHIPTSFCQKTALAAGSAILGFIEPKETRMIAILGETTGHFALKKMLEQMRRTQEGRQILFEKPIVDERDEKIGEKYLSTLPRGTLGGDYYHYMTSNGYVFPH
jgi:ubiquinone biosynthesis protein COQ4